MVGASSDPTKFSYGVLRVLHETGYDMIPVNPNEAGSQIRGLPVYVIGRCRVAGLPVYPRLILQPLSICAGAIAVPFPTIVRPPVFIAVIAVPLPALWLLVPVSLLPLIPLITVGASPPPAFALPLPLALLAMVGVGLIFGAFNAFFITRVRVTAFIVTPDEEDGTRMLLIPSKMNIAPIRHGLAYRIEGCLIHSEGLEIATSRIMYESTPVTITADAQTKAQGQLDPALTYQITSGNLIGPDAFSGSLTRDPGEALGNYAITQGSVVLSSNYTLTYVGNTLTITP
jgi:hypothetical protein